MKVLIIEDENEIASFLKDILEGEGDQVTICDSIEQVFENKYEMSHDFIILDLNLTGKSGDNLVVKLRKQGSKVPILVLSALGQIQTKIELFNLGADDYMTKPFDAEELKARMKSLRRRYLDVDDSDEEKIKDITFFWKQNKIVREGDEIHLTKKEAELLRFLLQHKGQTVSIEDILAKVWESKLGYQSNVVQSTMRRLRKKVDTKYVQKILQNVHGVGYSLVLPD